MLDCLILGDSLAVGVGQLRPECTTHAKSGINSYDYVNRFVLHTNGDTNANTVIISLGSNDTKRIKTFDELVALREQVKGSRVYWILPNIKDNKREEVQRVADLFKDYVIDARKYDVSPDKVHPTYRGYKHIAEDTR
jgi:lysophospholipase L1-like esterase